MAATAFVRARIDENLKDEAAAVAPAKAPARQESEVVQATGGLPVTGVDAGVLAGIAGALPVLGALLIGRRATAN